MRLNLGCGHDYRAGYVNCDLWAERCDVRADLRAGLPFVNCSFEEVYASGILEQIGQNEQFRTALNECHRVLQDNGQLVAIVPNARFPIAFRDPFDCRRFTEETWNYLDKKSRYFQMYGSLYGFLPWSVQSVETNGNGIMIALLRKA